MRGDSTERQINPLSLGQSCLLGSRALRSAILSVVFGIELLSGHHITISKGGGNVSPRNTTEASVHSVCVCLCVLVSAYVRAYARQKACVHMCVRVVVHVYE